MKYILIVTVIATLSTLAALFFETNLTKIERQFLIVILIVLIVTGAFFSYQAQKEAVKEKNKQTTVLGDTFTNTKDLQLKADNIILDLKRNIEKAQSLSDSIGNFNSSLEHIQEDIRNQINVLNSTLTQTREFEKLVSTQLELEKKKISILEPNLFVTSTNESLVTNINNTDFYSLSFPIMNGGKRIAKNITISVIILDLNKEEKIIDSHRETIKLSELNYDVANETSFTTKPIYSKDNFPYDMEIIVAAIFFEYDDDFNKKRLRKSVYVKSHKINNNSVSFIFMNEKNVRGVNNLLKEYDLYPSSFIIEE